MRAATTIRSIVAVMVVLALLGSGYAVVNYTRQLREPLPGEMQDATPVADNTPANVIELSSKTAELARIKTSEVVRSERPRRLDLRGSLAINPDKLAHVHARFPGQIVELATAEGGNGQPRAGGKALGFMDHVTKGQDLAVLWSKDLGEKKSELVDALARSRLDRQQLERLQKLYEKGATPEQSVRAATLQAELDTIAAARAERTLRSWMLTDDEINAVKAEAERLFKGDERRSDQDSDWARLDIVAPLDGTIVEKNVAIGDIVDTSADLFKIADMTVLKVWLHAYEEDLPYLKKIPTPIKTRIRLPSNPELGELSGEIDVIGDIIDPNEHMALLIGSVDNSKAGLRAGQFITASVPIPPDPDVVEIPAKALIDQGNESYVFVQPDAGKPRYVRHQVIVSRRLYDVVFIASQLSQQQLSDGYSELHPGERVVSSGISQLEEILQTRQTADADTPDEAPKP